MKSNTIKLLESIQHNLKETINYDETLLNICDKTRPKYFSEDNRIDFVSTIDTNGELSLSAFDYKVEPRDDETTKNTIKQMNEWLKRISRKLDNSYSKLKNNIEQILNDNNWHNGQSLDGEDDIYLTIKIN